MSAQTVDALSGSGGGGFSLPDPSRYFAAIIVYMSLAAVAMFGDKPGKLAAGFGGVAALAMLIAPTKRTGKPLAMSLTDFFTQVIEGGLQKPTGSSAPAAGPGYVNPNAPPSEQNPATPANPAFQGPLPSASGPYVNQPGGFSTDTTRTP
jgi:hypothetical protein